MARERTHHYGDGCEPQHGVTMDSGSSIKETLSPPSQPAMPQESSHTEEEETVADPIEEAEHFNQEAIERAAELGERMHRRQRDHYRRAVIRRFMHNPPTSDKVIQAHEHAREMGMAFALWLVDALPWSPERERALDAIDDATKHANAAIARYQMRHPADVPLEFDTPE